MLSSGKRPVPIKEMMQLSDNPKMMIADKETGN